jgi:hypothetical protein
VCMYIYVCRCALTVQRPRRLALFPLPLYLYNFMHFCRVKFNRPHHEHNSFDYETVGTTRDMCMRFRIYVYMCMCV